MTELQRKYDFLVVGAGMAGASIGAELAAHGSVLVIEMEDQPGYHATGRSVAFWTETYGGPGVQPLTSASGPLLHNPDPAFSDMSFLSPRGTLHIGTQAEVDAREQMIDSFAGAGVEFHRLDEQALHTRIAGLCPEYSIGLAEPSTSDIDVAALHAAYLALLRRRGGDVITRSALQGAERISGGDWQVTTTGGIFAAGLLINAAGAWADEVARFSGARPIGITPLQRTVVQLRTDQPTDITDPIIVDLALNFYFKAVGQDRLWLSPHDEIPVPPGDAAPEELDVAIAIDRFEHVVDWRIAAVERKWAGLRSFAPDRLPIYGFDVRVPNFFWFAGQGGFGIQTAPAAARLAAALVTGSSPDAAVAHIDGSAYAPARFG